MKNKYLYGQEVVVSAGVAGIVQTRYRQPRGYYFYKRTHDIGIILGLKQSFFLKENNLGRMNISVVVTESGFVPD